MVYSLLLSYGSCTPLFFYPAGIPLLCRDRLAAPPNAALDLTVAVTLICAKRSTSVMAVLPHSINVGSVIAHIYAHTAFSSASKTSVLFILHGHPASARHMKPIADGVFDFAVKKANSAPQHLKRNLIVVTFVSCFGALNRAIFDVDDVLVLGSWRGGRGGRVK